MVLTFFVSPMVVHSLGGEAYGLWVIIVSITGYFTVLDLGINTAIVKYVSEYFSREDLAKVRQVFSSSLIIFVAVALLILAAGGGISSNFESFFRVEGISSRVILLTFWVVVVEMAIGMVFSVFSGTLAALQEFVAVNAIAITTSLLRNLLIVICLLNGYGILELALIQLCTSLLRCAGQFGYLRWRYRGIYFEPRRIDLAGFRTLYSYSIYSFIIAIALKVLFYTDSLVIGRLIGLQQVTYYAIPSTLLDYIEKFVWAMIAVLVPVISGNSALGQESGNRRLYLLGTRYSLLLSAPVIICLFWIGPDFITLWMGKEIGVESMWVLRILLLGYGLAFSQLVAHGLLKGIARHRVLALVMIVEAAANLLLSVLLAPRYGIEGVAIGTALPLWAASFVLMVYTCRCLQMSLGEYLLKGYSGALASILLVGTAAYYLLRPCEAYWQVFGQSFVVLLVFLAVTVPLCVDKEHLAMLRSRLPFPAMR
jgi:O-antigen/teichoic acid export membrane protein